MPGTATKKIAAARPPQPPPSPGPDAAEGMQILYTRPEVMLRILGFLAAPDLVTVALVSKKLQVLTETAAQKIVENKNPQRHLLPDALSVFANLPETCRWKRVACCIECQANFAALACEQCPINLSTVATYLAAYRVPSLRFALGTANHEYRQALANCVATGAAGGAGEADGGGEATGGAGAGAGTEETGSAAVKAALWKRGVLHFMNGELVPALEDFLCRQRLFINCSYEDFQHDNLALPAKGIPRGMRFSAEGLGKTDDGEAGAGEPGVLARLCVMKTFMPAWFGLEPLSTPRCPSPRFPGAGGMRSPVLGNLPYGVRRLALPMPPPSDEEQRLVCNMLCAPIHPDNWLANQSDKTEREHCQATLALPVTPPNARLDGEGRHSLLVGRVFDCACFTFAGADSPIVAFTIRAKEPHKQLTVKQAWIGVMEQMPWCAHNTLSGLGPGSALSRGVVDLSGAWTEAGNDASSM